MSIRTYIFLTSNKTKTCYKYGEAMDDLEIKIALESVLDSCELSQEQRAAICHCAALVDPHCGTCEKYVFAISKRAGFHKPGEKPPIVRFYKCTDLRSPWGRKFCNATDSCEYHVVKKDILSSYTYSKYKTCDNSGGNND